MMMMMMMKWEGSARLGEAPVGTGCGAGGVGGFLAARRGS